MTTALIHYAGRAGDHNDLAMLASPTLAVVLGERLGHRPTTIGQPTPSNAGLWDAELAESRSTLERMASLYDTLLGNGATPVAAISRCAVALATLPAVARHRPDAMVIWFDAHADLNTPASTETGYLGGLALSGALGLWNSGLGEGLAQSNTIVVGARDIDPAERRILEESDVALVRIGPNMAEDLHRAVAGRPVYVHIDCDVLEPGTVPTDYRVANGMTLTQLDACCQVLAQNEVVGLEIGELESDERDPSRSLGDAHLITRTLEPILHSIEAASRG